MLEVIGSMAFGAFIAVLSFAFGLAVGLKAGRDDGKDL